MPGAECQPSNVDIADVRYAALARAAGLASSATKQPGETFTGAVEKSVIDEVVALLRQDGLIVRVGPHGTNPTERCTITVVYPKERPNS